MQENTEYNIITEKMELTDYILYLQYKQAVQEIIIKNDNALFDVWDNGGIRVGGDEFTNDEFYKLLASVGMQFSCNGVVFEYKDNMFISQEPISIKEEIISAIISF